MQRYEKKKITTCCEKYCKHEAFERKELWHRTIYKTDTVMAGRKHGKYRVAKFAKSAKVFERVEKKKRKECVYIKWC